MGELGLMSFVPVEKLLLNISSIFPRHIKKKKKNQQRVPLSYEFAEIQAAKFLNACQWLKF